MSIADSANDQRKLVHTLLIPIRWGDMDALGHVNNTVYFRYMEQARIECLAHSNCMPDPEGNGPVIINASCTFFKPLKYPGTVEVRTYVGQIGRSSFETYYEMRLSSDNDQLYAQGQAKVVWVNPTTEKSTPLPPEITKLWSAL